MNITQLAQRVDAPAINSTAEAVRGLAKDRSLLMAEWKNTSRCWMHYESFAKEQAERIEKIDARIDLLLRQEDRNKDVGQ